MGITPIPGWLIMSVVFGTNLVLLAILVLAPRVEPPELAYWTTGSPFSHNADL